ncbi:MAG: hypothetical protein ABI972_15200 [Acidobacteriota bacterium]
MDSVIIGLIALMVAVVLIRRIGSWMNEVRTPPKRRPLSAARAAYRDNPDATASCEHLQAVELAMRMAGLSVELFGGGEHQPVVRAACRINEPELRRVFTLPEAVFYKEGYEAERTPHDFPRADLICQSCMATNRARSDILVLHPDECRDDTPWFPSPPAG